MLGHLSQFEIRERQNLERKIARVICADALKAGYALNLNNGGDTHELAEPTTDLETVLAAMFQTDQEHVLVYRDGKQIGWVFFVYGNDGWDVVNDYTTNLEPIMGRANKIADAHS